MSKRWINTDPLKKRDRVVKYAMTWMRETEVRGSGSNPRILKLIKEVFPEATDDSKVSWCAVFVYHCLMRSGCTALKTGLARDYLKYGKPSTKPDIGDIVIFWRQSPTSWKGHVGFYVGEVGNKIQVLGGNQRNQVSIALYPKSRVLGYRMPH